MKRGLLLSGALVITLIAFGVFLDRANPPESVTTSRHRTQTNRPLRFGTGSKLVPDQPTHSGKSLTSLVRELDAVPPPVQREKLQADRLERSQRALELFRTLGSLELASYPAEFDALETSGYHKRILLDALFQAWGEKAPLEAMAAAETRTGEDAKAVLVGWAANDWDAPWQWLTAHSGMTPILGLPKANYLQGLIPALAEHGPLDALATLVNGIPEKPVKEFALSFFAAAAMAQSPEYMERWLREIPSKELGMPANAVGGYLAQQGLEAVHEFVIRQGDTIQDLIINGAVMHWTLNGRGDAVLDYVKRYPGPDDASDDRLLRAIGTAAIMGNADASLQLLSGIRNSEMRDVSLEGAAALLTGSAPAKAFNFALRIADESKREKRLAILLTATARRRPEEARTLVDGSSLPETTKARLRNAIESRP